mmetsp:Transcript_6595/g.18472  ORF Transcript_6595/g.18472 Transcript_6595/m.18472 type:complete len:271 (+) Transcript_6595:171-983(+)
MEPVRSTRSRSRASTTGKPPQLTIEATEQPRSSRRRQGPTNDATPRPWGSESKRKRRHGDDNPISSGASSVAVEEASSTATSLVNGLSIGQSLGPRPQDCVFGRGWDVDHRPGNVAFRRIISQYLTRYQDATCRLSKNLIQREIVAHFKEQGGGTRFMEKQGQLWTVADDEKARKKVGQVRFCPHKENGICHSFNGVGVAKSVLERLLSHTNPARFLTHYPQQQIRYQIEKRREPEEADTDTSDLLSNVYGSSLPPPSLDDKDNERICSV